VRRRTPAALLLAAAALMTLAPSLASARKVKIKLATLAPKGSVFHRVLSEMGHEWAEASGGKVKVILMAGGIAGDDVDVVRKIRLGTLSGGLLTSAGVATVDKAINCLQAPMVYNSYAELDAVHAKMDAKLEALYAEKGFIILNWVDAGWVRFFSQAPVKVPDDLAKQKLFVWAGHEAVADIWKGAGFNPVPLPSTEISTALQTGLVNAVPTTPQAALLMQWYKHAKYMSTGRWAPLVGATVISKKQWEKIPEDLRPEFRRIAKAAGDKLRAEARPADQRAIDEMAKRGLTVVEMDAATLAMWRKRLEPSRPKIRGEWASPELYDEAMQHLAAFKKLGAFTDGTSD
jgi:TRAP-type transport system periplasmic protein